MIITQFYLTDEFFAQMYYIFEVLGQLFTCFQKEILKLKINYVLTFYVHICFSIVNEYHVFSHMKCKQMIEKAVVSELLL